MIETLRRATLPAALTVAVMSPEERDAYLALNETPDQTAARRVSVLHPEASQHTYLMPKDAIASGKANLALNALGLTDLPDGLLGTKNNLLELDLSINNFNSFPQSLQVLNRLQKLYIYGNQIDSLPSAIGKMGSLTELQLNGNLLENLPSQLGDCVALEKLEICNNRLQCLPAQIGRLTNLTELKLAGNPLVELPQTIGHCVNLEVRSFSCRYLQNLRAIKDCRFAFVPACDPPGTVDLCIPYFRVGSGNESVARTACSNGADDAVAETEPK